MLKLSYFIATNQFKYHPPTHENLYGPIKDDDPCINPSSLISPTIIFLQSVLTYVNIYFMMQAHRSQFYQSSKAVKKVRKCLVLIDLAWKLIEKEVKTVFNSYEQCLQQKKIKFTLAGIIFYGFYQHCNEMIMQYYFLKCRMADLTLMKQIDYKQCIFDPITYIFIVDEIENRVVNTFPNKHEDFVKLYNQVYKSILDLRNFAYDNYQQFWWNKSKWGNYTRFKHNHSEFIINLFSSQDSINSSSHNSNVSNTNFIINFYKNHFCQSCKTRNKQLKACKGCRNVYYCSRTCQKRGWTLYKHRDNCGNNLIVI